jgi:hypothetical protein
MDRLSMDSDQEKALSSDLEADAVATGARKRWTPILTLTALLAVAAVAGYVVTSPQSVHAIKVASADIVGFSTKTDCVMLTGSTLQVDTFCSKNNLADGSYQCKSKAGCENIQIGPIEEGQSCTFDCSDGKVGEVGWGPTSTCFPSEASVVVDGLGKRPISKLSIGDRILVNRWDALIYEPVLGFLHFISDLPDAQHEFLYIWHATGVFRATAGHLVFVATIGSKGSSIAKAVTDLQVGDELLSIPSDASTIIRSTVIGIRRGKSSGMYAPLTPSGTIVVDDVIASNYATPQPSVHLPHGAAHAAMFLARAFAACGFNGMAPQSWPGKNESAEEMNSLAMLLYRHLKLERLLRIS